MKMDKQLQQGNKPTCYVSWRKKDNVHVHASPPQEEVLSRSQTQGNFQKFQKSVEHETEIYGVQAFLISCGCRTPHLSN